MVSIHFNNTDTHTKQTITQLNGVLCNFSGLPPLFVSFDLWPNAHLILLHFGENSMFMSQIVVLTKTKTKKKIHTVLTIRLAYLKWSVFF